ncbi:type IV toxin-antitoxin system AbiEi family antitoxin domain-containing protein [Nocardioides aquiterrae]|uniref:AbiEi antitoxin N-terminal domain-containing protein n=1 Tax=Nocardioides aquiterrae TaxID=203799 RepID=A0ABN1UNQ8_9ACTN
MEKLLRAQAGTASRRQLEQCGLDPHDIERLLRRRELVRVLPGVFVDHTGPLTWLQRAWVGTLYYAPAVLAGDSALRGAIAGWRCREHAIWIAIDESRRRDEVPGYRVCRVRGLTDRIQPNASPPRLRLEEAAIDEALRQPTELAAIGLLADVCQSRRTTARRILLTMEARPRVRRRTWLQGVLTDIADGTCSTLEHGYLHRVEQPHGLPRGRRQVAGRARSGGALRDVDYDPLPQVVELDGRLFHDSAGQRDRDLDRDLDAAVDGRSTIRLGWGQVFERPCYTASRVSALLVRAGWTGRGRKCGPSCVF